MTNLIGLFTLFTVCTGLLLCVWLRKQLETARGELIIHTFIGMGVILFLVLGCSMTLEIHPFGLSEEDYAFWQGVYLWFE